MLLLTSHMLIEEFTSFEGRFASHNICIVSRCYFRCYKTSAIEISAEVKMHHFCFQSTEVVIKYKSLRIFGHLNNGRIITVGFAIRVVVFHKTACPRKEYWLELMFLNVQSIKLIFTVLQIDFLI